MASAMPAKLAPLGIHGMELHKHAHAARGLEVPDLNVPIYGMTALRTEDPDGNRLWIGQSRSS